MSIKTTTINVRMDKETKSSAQKIIEDFGLDISTAITAFFRKIIQTGSIPFSFDQKGRLNDPKYIAQLVKEIESAKKQGKKYSSATYMLGDILG
ncbi:MAG: type II toxin-antitoxin system RelB/DinJ family antitoxin [Patescibacteria group bacterium]